MRKVFMFNLITLDGFFEGPNRDISWHNVDDEFNEFAIHQLGELDTLLFGRVTYQLMASYWPTPVAIESDPIVAAKMNEIPKVVFSRTLDSVDWSHSRLAKNAEAEISNLKQQPGKDMAIFGSANLAASLIPAGLIDEFRIILNPVVLGKGTPLFQGVNDKLNLKLLRTKTFHNGNILLYYQPVENRGEESK